MLRPFTTAALLMALLSSPCDAAIQFLPIGKTIGVTAGSNAITTITSDCPVGSVVVAFASYLVTADVVSSVTDSGGNVYQSPLDNIAGTGIGIGFAYAKNTTVDLPIGSTIIVTFAGSTASSVGAICLRGADPVSPLDNHNNTAQGLAGTTATTVTTPTLANADEIVFGVLGTASATGTLTCNGAFASQPITANSTPSLIVCRETVTSTAPVSFAPSWANARNWVTDVISVQGVAVTFPGLASMGVGP